MLESHLRHRVTPTGAQRFRLSLLVTNPTWQAAAADGQMGLIVRCDMQAQKEGDEWLRQWYPAIKSLMEFCWQPGGWDADRQDWATCWTDTTSARHWSTSFATTTMPQYGKLVLLDAWEHTG